MAKYLSYTGLSYLWSKIKLYFAKKKDLDIITGNAITDTKLGDGTTSDDTHGEIRNATGRTVVWNQILDDRKIDISSGGIYANYDSETGVYTLGGTSTGGANLYFNKSTYTIKQGHKYLFNLGEATSDKQAYIVIRDNNLGVNYILIDLSSPYQKYQIVSPSQDYNLSYYLNAGGSGYTIAGTVAPRIFDLTQMFGAGNEPSTVDEFEALFPLDYYAYNAGTMLGGTVTGFKSIDADGNTLSNLSIPITTLTGKQEGSSTSETMFPYGLNGIANVKDEIDFEHGTAVRRIGVREYNSSTDTGDDILTDGTTTAYELATPITYTIDTIPSTVYSTRKDGKEIWLPEQSATPGAAPLDWNTAYGMNIVEEIDDINSTLPEKADISSVLIPNFDNLTPLKTIEFDVSATSYYQLFTRSNTGISATMSEVNDVVMFRITVRGSNIYGRADCVVKFRPGVTYPFVIGNNDTFSVTAGASNIYSLRVSRPKTLNSGYPWVCDINEYNTTARHIKVEVFATTENITWVTDKTESTFDSTYHTSSDYAIYNVRGFFTIGVVGTKTASATTADTASAETVYHRTFFTNYSLKAGEALVTHKLVYASEGKAWLISNKTYPIDTDICISNLRTSVSADSNIDCSYLSNQMIWTINTDTALQSDTFAQYDKVYLRCNLVDGKIYSDAYLAKEMTPGYTWYMLGVMYTTTNCNLNTMGSFFITLDDAGRITHINGMATSDSLLEGQTAAVNKTGDVVSSIDNRGEIKKIGGRSVVWNQLAKNGNFDGTTYWTATYGDITTSNNECKYVVTTVGTSAQNRITNQVSNSPNVVSGHKYFVSINAKLPYAAQFGVIAYSVSKSTTTITVATLGTGSVNAYITGSKIVTASESGPSELRFYVSTFSDKAVGDEYYFKNINFIDLTQMFGTGNEPSTVEEFEALFPEDYYAYNAGTMLGGTVTGFKSTNAGGYTLTNLSIPVTTMTGKQDGSNISEVMFPYGLNGIGNVKDEIEFAGAKYEQLEYLETDGACAIATDLLLDGSEEWEIKFQSSKATLDNAVAGSLNGGSSYETNNNFSVTGIRATGNNAYCIYRNVSAIRYYYLGDRTDKLVHVENWKGLNALPTLDGVSMTGTISSTAITPSVPWTLFGRSTTSISDRTYAQDGVRIFYFKGDGFNYIPCRRVSDGVLGFFDTVSEKFHTNVGTGTFRYGSIIGTVSRTKARAVRKIGVVDLGSLTWTIQPTYGAFATRENNPTFLLKATGVSGAVSKLLANGYVTGSFSKLYSAGVDSKLISGGGTITSTAVCISLPADKNTNALIQAYLDGVLLYYELETPIEFTLDSVPSTTYKTRKGGKEVWLPAHSSAPTAAPVDWSTAYGMNAVEEIDNKAPLASPALTGIPTAPTANVGTNTTQIATTAFVQGEISSQLGNIETLLAAI